MTAQILVCFPTTDCNRRILLSKAGRSISSQVLGAIEGGANVESDAPLRGLEVQLVTSEATSSAQITLSTFGPISTANNTEITEIHAPFHITGQNRYLAS